MTSNDVRRERIVIVGGGFAGLNLVKHLDKKKFEVVLVDRNNFHSFPPLFYQLASSGVDAGSISFPFRRELRKYKKQGVRFHMGVAQSVNTSTKVLTTDCEQIPYDRLIIAAGTTNNFFGNSEIERRVYTIKSTSEAIRCRNEILDRMERAATCHDREQRRRLLSFVVIGGGPTGVEVAGAIGEMKRYIMPREYPDIPPEELQITIVEGADTLLQAMSERSQQQAAIYLGSLMVNVRTGEFMKSYTDDGLITFNDGTTMQAGMVIWTAGITGVSITFEGSSAPTMGPGNRLVVDEYNRVDGLSDVYAVGDICIHTDTTHPRGCPQLAQVAIQQARLLARQLNRGEFTTPFVYKDKGTMATIGRNRAVVDLPHMHIFGRPAWFIWMFIHLISILGMRNKLTVLINWVWAYFTYATSLRLIILPPRFPVRHRWGN